MNWRSKTKTKATSVGRHSRLPAAQKPASFQYSSNRMGADRGFDRGGAERKATKLQKIKNKLKRIPYAVSFICLLLGLIYLSTLDTKPQIIFGGDQQLIRDKKSYQDKSTELLGSKLIYRTKLSFDTQGLAQQLQDSFPELKTVEVSTPLLRHRPVIEMIISSPAIVFMSGNSTYLLDERGIALFDLKQTAHKVNTDQLPIISDQTKFPVEVNKPALTSDQVKFVHDIVRQTSAKQLQVTSMELSQGGGQLDVRFKNLPYNVKFNFYENSRVSAGAFLAAKEQVERDGTKPAEYIDVRIPSRAYVK